MDNRKPDSRVNLSITQTPTQGKLSIYQRPTHGHNIDITKPESMALYRYSKSRFKEQTIDNTNPQIGHAIDITKPDPKALYAYYKARFTGNPSITQSPTDGKISMSQNTNHGNRIDITKPE
jgi:hypothetical protein